MPCIICSLLRLRIIPERQSSVSSDLARELDDLDRFTFSSLTALLAVLAISGSKALSPAVLALLIYTISLRLAVGPCFVQRHPAVTRFLHVVPLLGTFCMTGVELVLDMHSPALAAVVLLVGVVPFVASVFHHGAEDGLAPAVGRPAAATPN